MSEENQQSRKERIHYLLKQGVPAERVVAVAREIDSYICGDKTLKNEVPQYKPAELPLEEPASQADLPFQETMSRKHTIWYEVDRNRVAHLIDSGYSIQEVANMTGRTHKAIMNQLSRGLIQISRPDVRRRFKVYGES